MEHRRAQPEVVALEGSGLIRGRVLDVGCGTGENVLFLAWRGYPTVGIDISPTAIERARAKAVERGITATFYVGNAVSIYEMLVRRCAGVERGVLLRVPAEAPASTRYAHVV